MSQKRHSYAEDGGRLSQHTEIDNSHRLSFDINKI